MDKLTLIARVLLGLVFFVFGLNGFLNFLPQPELPQAAGAAMGALLSLGYLIPVVKGVEVVAGALLLSGRAVPFALTLLAPIVVNIVLFHLAFAPAGGGPAYFALVAELFLAWQYRAHFRGVLNPGAQPAEGALTGQPAAA